MKRKTSDASLLPPSKKPTQPEKYGRFATKNFFCDHCKYSSSKLIYVTRHIKESHPSKVPKKATPEPIKCPKCTYTSSKLQYVTRHLKGHSGIPQTCEYCGLTSDFKPFFRRGSRSYHSCEAGNAAHAAGYKCTICDYVGATNGALKSHFSGHKGIVLTCDYCDYTTDIQNHMDRHVRHECAGSKAAKKIGYTCDKEGCVYKSKSHSAFVAHSRAHGGIFQTCEFCNYTSDIKTYMQRGHPSYHNCKEGRIAHAQGYKCTLCDFTSKSKTATTSHTKAHTGVEMICKYGCGFKSDIKNYFIRSNKAYHSCTKGNAAYAAFKARQEIKSTDNKYQKMHFSCEFCLGKEKHRATCKIKNDRVEGCEGVWPELNPTMHKNGKLVRRKGPEVKMSTSSSSSSSSIFPSSSSSSSGSAFPSMKGNIGSSSSSSSGSGSESGVSVESNSDNVLSVLALLATSLEKPVMEKEI